MNEIVNVSALAVVAAAVAAVWWLVSRFLSNTKGALGHVGGHRSNDAVALFVVSAYVESPGESRLAQEVLAQVSQVSLDAGDSNGATSVLERVRVLLDGPIADEDVDLANRLRDALAIAD